MGNAVPTNRTDQKVMAQKLENAKKLGVLSLCDYKLTSLPAVVFDIQNLTTLDLSHNHLDVAAFLRDPRLLQLASLKLLNLDHQTLKRANTAAASSSTQSIQQPLPPQRMDWTRLSKLHTVSLAQNQWNDTMVLPIFPASLKTLNLSSNPMTSLAPLLVTGSVELSKLDCLDVSHTQMTDLSDDDLTALVRVAPNLTALRLDGNRLERLPSSLGQFRRLKSLSLRDNRLTAHVALPSTLFTDTSLVDLKLHGNVALTNTIVNTWPGYDVFLERRHSVTSKTLNATLVDVCGLE